MLTHNNEEAMINHEMHFRALLIKVQDSLSDADRCRLHFLFGNIIPRRLRDDPSISGTLNLLESLFDRGVVNDQDFHYLIQAFRQIHRPDIAKRLEAHAREIGKEKNEVQSAVLQTIMDDTEEDKMWSAAGLQQAELHFKYDTNVNNNICTSLSLSKGFKTIEGRNSADPLLKTNSKEILTRWTNCRCLAIFNIIGMIAMVVLLIVTILQGQPINFKINDSKSLCYNKDVMPADPVVLAYLLSWWIDERSYNISNIPVQKITHLNYAFASIDSDGRIVMFDTKRNMTTQSNDDDDETNEPLPDNIKQLIELKKEYPHLRTLVSVGGDTFQEKFKTVIVTNESRSIFAASCVKFLEKYSFDGIDLDWRNPMSDGWPNHSGSSIDKQNNLRLLLKEIRDQLNKIPDKQYLLTLATGVNPEHIDKKKLSSIVEYVDWINVITYDFHDNQELVTGHNSPLYGNGNETLVDSSSTSYRSKLNCDAAIQAYIAAGVPSNKIIMGIPLYGRGWQKVKNSTLNGFLQSSSSIPALGHWNDVSFDYYHLKKYVISSYTRYWDDQSKVPFLYNKSTGIWISYDDLESVKWKTDYIKKECLGGAFFWEFSKDRQGELISATFNALYKDIYLSSRKPRCFSHRPPRISLPSNKILIWKPKVQYEVDHQVTYKNNIYRCLQSHRSIINDTPESDDSLWQIQSIKTNYA